MTLALATVWVSIAGSYEFNLPIGFFVGTFGALLYLGGEALERARAGRASGRCVTYE